MALKALVHAGRQLAANAHSEKIYDEMAYRCLVKCFIDFTSAQKAKLTALHENGGFEFRQGKKVYALSNSKKDTFKHVMRTPGLTGSPIYESNLSSQRIMENRHVLDIMNYLSKKEGKGHVKGAFLTFSFVNANFGYLSDADQALNDIYKKLKDYMRKTMDWGNAEFLGTMPYLEHTINKTNISKCSTYEIYHAHFHVIIFYNGELDFERAEEKLWNKFHKLCLKADVKSAAAAFMLKKTYNSSSEIDESYEKFKKELSEEEREARDIAELDGAIVEASKYSTKPADFNYLAPRKDDSKKLRDYKYRIFAEIYNAAVNPTIKEDTPYLNIKDKKAKKVRNNGSGLFQKAKQLFNAVVASGLGGVFDFQNADGDITRVPNFVTQLVKVNVDKVKEEKVKLSKEYQGHHLGQSDYSYKAEIVDQDELNTAEILYYNSNLLANTVMPASYSALEKIAKKSDHFNNAPKQKAALDLLKNFVQWNTREQDIHDVIDEWIETVIQAYDNGKYDEFKVVDLNKIHEAVSYSFSEDYHGEDIKVRNFKDLDTIECFDNKLNADKNAEKLHQELIEMKNNDEWILNTWNADVLKPYIELYVNLTIGKEMKDSTKENPIYGKEDWNYWKGVSSIGDPIDDIKHLYHLIMVHFASKEDKEAAAYTAMVDGSEYRKIGIQMDNEHFAAATKRLMKLCDSLHNCLFQQNGKYEKPAAQPVDDWWRQPAGSCRGSRGIRPPWRGNP